MDDPREDVAAALVGAEGMRQAGALQPMGDVEDDGIAGREFTCCPLSDLHNLRAPRLANSMARSAGMCTSLRRIRVQSATFRRRSLHKRSDLERGVECAPLSSDS